MPRCHIQNEAKTRAKVKGVINFFKLKNLSTNLYDTFQKCALYTRKVSYYTTVFREGVIGFMTPYDTFMTPFGRKTSHFSAIEIPKSNFLRHLSFQKCTNPLVELVCAVSNLTKGVIRCHIASLKGVISTYDIFSGQEALRWQF
jgi:hypothetical protein